MISDFGLPFSVFDRNMTRVFSFTIGSVYTEMPNHTDL